MVGRRRLQQMLGSPGRVTSLKATTPCAACKLLRRRCKQDCPFSPYFSPHEPFKFASVHKVFGASNVSKMLMEVPEARRVDTANSLIFEATMRLRDPVYGCMGAISALQLQIQSLHAELNAVRAAILKYKLREEANNLVTISSEHVSNNFITPSLYSAADVVASFSPPPQPHPTIATATFAVQPTDPTAITSSADYINQSFAKNSATGYSNRIIDKNCISRYFQ